MRKTFYLLLALFPTVLFSQNKTDKTIYFDSIGKDTSKENATTFRIIKDFSKEKDLYQVKDYYKSGVLKMEGNSKTRDGLSKDGLYTYYYENGQKKKTENYIKARLNGDFSEWYENGNPKIKGEYIDSESGIDSGVKIYDFWNSKNEHTVIKGNGWYEGEEENFLAQGNLKNGFKDGEWKGLVKDSKYQYIDLYKEGKFISGKSKNDKDEVREYTVLESRPLPKKGINHFYQFIGSNFVLPQEAIKNGISGKLIIQFVIEKDGKITDPKILKSLGYGLDEEAIRVITKYENWIPGKQRGLPVRVQYSIPLTL